MGRTRLYAVLVFLILTVSSHVNAQQFVISKTDTLITSESGGSAAFTIRLSEQPAADVRLPLSSSDETEGAVTKSEVTFTPSNWNQAQSVTLRGVDDILIDGDIEYQLVLGPATSTDPVWDGLDPANLDAKNLDNDFATDLSISKRAHTAVVNQGSSVKFTVTIKNESNVAPLDVVIEDPVPPGTLFVENSGDCVTSYPCQIGRLDPGQSRTVISTYAVQPSDVGRVVNTATVRSSAPDSKPSNDSATAVVEICPNPPKNLVPANLSTAPPSGRLSWQPTGADIYTVFLGPEGSGCNLRFMDTTESFLEYSGLTPGLRYEWRVVAFKDKCAERRSNCQSFEVEQGVCEDPSPGLVSPVNGQTVQRPVELVWTAVPDAIEYRLYAGSSPEDMEMVRAIFRELTRLDQFDLPNGEVFWRIEAVFDLCPPTSSEIGTFFVEPSRKRPVRRQ